MPHLPISTPPRPHTVKFQQIVPRRITGYFFSKRPGPYFYSRKPISKFLQSQRQTSASCNICCICKHTSAIRHLREISPNTRKYYRCSHQSISVYKSSLISQVINVCELMKQVTMQFSLS